MHDSENNIYSTFHIKKYDEFCTLKNIIYFFESGVKKLHNVFFRLASTNSIY